MELQQRKLDKPFRFETFWCQEESCKELIQSQWQQQNHMTTHNFTNLLSTIKSSLQRWSQSKFQHIPKKKKRKNRQVQELLDQAWSQCSSHFTLQEAGGHLKDYCQSKNNIGLRGHELIGSNREIKIRSFSTTMPHKEKKKKHHQIHHRCIRWPDTGCIKNFLKLHQLLLILISVPNFNSKSSDHARYPSSDYFKSPTDGHAKKKFP